VADEEPAAEEPAAAPAAPAPAPAAEAKPAPRKIDSPQPEPINLMSTGGAPVAKRVAPIVALVAIGWLLRVLIRRRRR
jgi:hypothetical protein